MKRLVVCCDGTWKSSKDPRISNIEKIARAITTRTHDDTIQLVHYCSGVGTAGSWYDRVLGGALGRGLDISLLDAYRYLALNYEPGDEIYVFGFSRGAYTARSLVGMISRVGLLTADNLACPPSTSSNLLDDALQAYRAQGATRGAQQRAVQKYTYGFTSPEKLPRITFIGVFDTVGALGIPGLTRSNYAFHDVELSDQVDCARQALAIDERRLTFEPCVWEKKADPDTDLQQVWFEGVHSDIGGGLDRSAPSDLTLAWMVSEAEGQGLRFDRGRLPGAQAERPAVEDACYAPHDSLTWAYRFVNVVRLCFGIKRGGVQVKRHKGQSRLLEVAKDPATPLYIAAPARQRWHEQPTRAKQAQNVSWWVDLVGPDALEDRVITIPELGEMKDASATRDFEVVGGDAMRRGFATATS
ncbi:DUF2235 domain-containing protein [Gordonia sp. SL306]|uniref:DUF2235 domain-containing protein n=1 Tax=Gordonia sp. SL306 TaxID=2995145 RepID=UPI002270BD43|nr:DUF2235 domain-containing protein [Gordonia sp. SL306]WAC55501.1 DUF2235 domain-containing protein [Gordonia sp. SL306]